MSMDGSFERRVIDLQNSLELLRTEVDMKMKIMEEILSTRNQQFLVHKKLIEQEQVLFENVLSRWRNPTGFVGTDSTSSTDRSHRFASRSSNTEFNTLESPSVSNSTKRSSTEAFGSTSDRLRLRAKRRTKAASYDDPESDPLSTSGTAFEGKKERYGDSNSGDIDESADDTLDENLDLFQNVEACSDGDSDDGDFDESVDNNGFEKRVFVNFYSTDPADGEGSTDQIWQHFLHEEKGTTALCKHCDAKGCQKIYKLKNPALTVLRRHLKRKHKIIVEPPADPTPMQPGDESVNTVGRRRSQMRHNNYMYKRFHFKRHIEYFRCRDYATCRGRAQRRNGVVEQTAEHSCLTTEADCDAVEVRDKIRDMAEDNPTMTPAEIIAAAKEGYSSEVLDILPSDLLLSRTIKRIRQNMMSAAPLSSDWT